jgi:hypothetical protein
MSRRDSEHLLRALLLAELDQARAEADSLRASIRYRLGDLLLQGFPLSWRSLKVIPKFFFLYRTYKRGGSVGGVFKPLASVIPSEAYACRNLMLSGENHIAAADVWCTADAAALAARLDARAPCQLTLRFVTESIARRLGRLKMQGCHIIWWPEVEQTDSPLESYVRALADEHRVGGGD